MMKIKDINAKGMEEVVKKDHPYLEIEQEAKKSFFKRNGKELICLVIAFFIGGSFGTSGKYYQSEYEELVQVNEKYKSTLESKQEEIEEIKREVINIEEYLK